MSQQLVEAVQLAQAGQREAARQLLWQVVQRTPDDAMAWLWLASVAADTNEYMHALNEVLRIDPHNTQAQQMLAMAQSAQPAPSYSPPPSAGVPGRSYPGPASGQGVAPAGVFQTTGSGARGVSQSGASPFSSTGQASGGCGCGRGCLIFLLLAVVIPALACGALSYTSSSLGPFDVLAVYLPSDFGRKTVDFDAAGYGVSVDVPRSWYLAVEGDTMWELWRDALNDALPFEGYDEGWNQFERDLDDFSSISRVRVAIVEANPVTLSSGGFPNEVVFGGVDDGTFTCSYVESNQTRLTEQVQRGTDARFDMIERDDGLCGYRVESIQRVTTRRYFENFDAPDEVRYVYFAIPLTSSEASVWEVMIAEDQYGTFDDDVDAMIDSVSVSR